MKILKVSQTRQDKNEAIKAQHKVEFIYCALIELLKIHTDFHTTLHTLLHGDIVSIFSGSEFQRVSIVAKNNSITASSDQVI